jgi:hypothetical protein
MATIKQSRQVNMEGWKPVIDSTSKTPPPNTESQRTGRSPYMLSSMPYNATQNDGVQRQFYGGANTNTSRIFVPILRRGGI